MAEPAEELVESTTTRPWFWVFSTQAETGDEYEESSAEPSDDEHQRSPEETYARSHNPVAGRQLARGIREQRAFQLLPITPEDAIFLFPPFIPTCQHWFRQRYKDADGPIAVNRQSYNRVVWGISATPRERNKSIGYRPLQYHGTTFEVLWIRFYDSILSNLQSNQFTQNYWAT